MPSTGFQASWRAPALVGESVQQKLVQSEHAAKDGGGGGQDRRGYWLMHPTEGATYSAYCD